MAKTKWEHYCREWGGWRPGLPGKCYEDHRVKLIRQTDAPQLGDNWKVR